MEINILKVAGKFAEDKDIAREIRTKEIIPSLKKGENVILNFEGVESATQSFIHALISEVIREYKPSILEKIEFKHCSETIKRIVEIVVDYMQQED